MFKLLAATATAVLVLARPASAGEVPAAEQARLAALPPVRVPLRGATLASAIRLLASDAKLSYLSPADAEFGDRIGSDATVNPYHLLQILAKDYNFEMDYDDGLWRFTRVNPNELITKAYPLHFNNLTPVSISSHNLSSQLAAASGGMGGMGSGGLGGGGGSGGTPGGLGSHGMDSGGASGSFDARPSRILEDVKKILAIPADGGPDRKDKVAPAKVDPIWDTDTSTLFVVATKRQHELISQYLKTVDRPQRLIRIAVKFVETQRNPSQNLGVDWSQTVLGNGGPITLSGVPDLTTAVTGATTGTGVTTTSTSSSTSSSTTTSTSSATNLPIQRQVAIGGKIPVSLLSAPAMAWTVQAIASDRRSSVVQDPVIFTANNHPVEFKATTEEPIQQGSTTFGSATAATATSITYLEVGTQLTVLPNLLPGDGAGREIVQCNFSINVSSIIGTQLIGGNPYPVTSDRSYSYSVPIPTGKTLVIAGLEERSRLMSDSKVPLFGDIPLIGYAFKNRSDQVTHTTLLAFITPEVVDDPGAVAPVELPALHHRVFQGSPTESISEIKTSLDGLPSDIAALESCAKPANKQAVLNALDHIAIELSLMDVRLGELRLTNDKLVAPQTKRMDQDKELLASAKELVTQVSTFHGT